MFQALSSVGASIVGGVLVFLGMLILCQLAERMAYQDIDDEEPRE